MKTLSIDILIGQTIASFEEVHEQSLLLTLADGKKWVVSIDDDGAGGNESHAFLNGVDLSRVVGHKITEAFERRMKQDGAELVIKAGKYEGFIRIVHESNGYYGWSYEMVEQFDCP